MLVNKGRGVAQLGSALGSGPRGREFKSPLPDHPFICILLQIKSQTLSLGRKNAIHRY